jgi:hypothetical protein
MQLTNQLNITTDTNTILLQWSHTKHIVSLAFAYYIL